MGLRKRFFAGGAVFAIVFGLFTGTGQSGSLAADPGFQVQLGYEQKVLGPSGIVDFPYFNVTGSDGKLYGMVANNDTYMADVSANGSLSNPKVVLRRGGAGRFDQCGAWLMGTVHEITSTHWVSFYHAEAADPADMGRCVFKDGHTRWSIGYAETFNAGKTWTKPDYPHNQIITQDSALTGDLMTDDAGNGRVIEEGGYFYLFFQASSRVDPVRRLNVARAPISSLGRPGSWSKYYCSDVNDESTCGFTQPGRGGQSTHLRGIPAAARYISYNTYLGRFIGVQASGLGGFALWLSDGDDFLHWTERRLIYPAVSSADDPTVDRWGAYSPTDKQVYGYASLIGADGDSSVTGQDFYLYYMKVYPGDDFSKRYLLRRKIGFVRTSAVPSDRVQLTTYIRSDGRRRTSSEAPEPGEGYRVQTSTGYLLSSARDGYAPVFECAASRSTDHYIKQNSCSGTDQPVRRLGWIATSKTAEATVPVYRCVNRQLKNHFASTSEACDGAQKEFLLGYALPNIR